VSLQALLDEGLRFDAEYGHGLANHLPMAQLALHRLGADSDRLAAFGAQYARRLEPARAEQPWPAGEAWPDRLGDAAAWPAYRSLFRQWLAVDGAPNTLAQVLPQLMPGCGAAAFHGMIRCAYAVHAGHDGELADDLAYWAARYLPLDGRPPGTDFGLIVERMEAAAALPGFAAEVEAEVVDAGTLERLARAAARLYACSGNFTVLHLVTSSHAMRDLLAFVNAPMPALQAYVRAVVAGRQAARARPAAAPPLRPWADLIDAALGTDDEHLIKLVDSCREQERHYGGDDWQHAASRGVADAGR
jgi:hypothetical protein